MNRDSTSRQIALIGDYSAEVIAHGAIPRALALAGEAEGTSVAWEWISTPRLTNPAAELQNFSALWVVPGSPYENMEGVLTAIRWARESRRPIFGSCGGFQHMMIEFARNVAGLVDADHAETNPSGSELVIAPLACSLVGKSGALTFVSGSRLAHSYASATATEAYHCNFGLNSTYREGLEKAGMHFTAFDEGGEIRGAELPESVHPFYCGTLFQPERRILSGEIPPLARALVRAANRFTP